MEAPPTAEVMLRVQGGPLRGGRLFCALALVCLMGLAANATAAKAEQVSFAFGDGRVNLGQFKGERLVDPANPSLIASLIASIDPATGDFIAPANGLFIPPRTFEDQEAGGFTADVVAEFRALGQISGNFDLASGALDTNVLDLQAVLSLYNAGHAGNEAQLQARCSVAPIPVPLDSSGELVDESDPDNPVTYSAEPFDPDGAAVASWDDLPASTAVAGTFAPFVCPIVDEMAGGPGGVWLAGGVSTGPDPAGPVQATAPKPANPKQRAKRCRKGKRRAKGGCGRKRKKRQ